MYIHKSLAHISAIRPHLSQFDLLVAQDVDKVDITDSLNKTICFYISLQKTFTKYRALKTEVKLCKIHLQD